MGGVSLRKTNLFPFVFELLPWHSRSREKQNPELLERVKKLQNSLEKTSTMLPKGKVPGRKRLRKKKYDRPAAPPPSSASSQFSSSPRKLKLPSRSPSHSQKKLHRGGADNPDSNINSNSTRVQASLLATLSPASNDDPTSNDSSSPLSQPLHTEDALSALSKVIKTEVESWAEEVSSMQINKGLVQGEDEVTEALLDMKNTR